VNLNDSTLPQLTRAFQEGGHAEATVSKSGYAELKIEVRAKAPPRRKRLGLQPKSGVGGSARRAGQAQRQPEADYFLPRRGTGRRHPLAAAAAKVVQPTYRRAHYLELLRDALGAGYIYQHDGYICLRFPSLEQAKALALHLAPVRDALDQYLRVGPVRQNLGCPQAWKAARKWEERRKQSGRSRWYYHKPSTSRESAVM
jgi:hypothetical protein